MFARVTLVPVLALLLAVGCDKGDEPDKPKRKTDSHRVVEPGPSTRDTPQTRTVSSKPSKKVLRAGRLPRVVVESSGLVASRRQPGVYWTHGDSGTTAELFAVDFNGKLLGRYDVAAPNRDWEDIGIDDAGHLYIADIGNNNGNVGEVAVYQIAEPQIAGHAPTTQPTSQSDPAATLPATNPQSPIRNPQSPAPLRPTARWRLRYPDDKIFDAESLFVWDGKGYVISKEKDGKKADLYRFDLDANRKTQTLEKACTLPIRIPITGAGISADGTWLGIVSVAGPFLIRIDGDPARAGSVDSAHATFVSLQMEAVCFAPDGLLISTEEGDLLLFPWAAFGAEEPARK